MNYSESIKSVRKLLGISQGELSMRSGLSQNFISRLENGHGQPLQSTINTLAKSMGVDKWIIDFMAIEEKDLAHKEIFDSIKGRIHDAIDEMINNAKNRIPG